MTRIFTSRKEMFCCLVCGSSKNKKGLMNNSLVGLRASIEPFSVTVQFCSIFWHKA